MILVSWAECGGQRGSRERERDLAARPKAGTELKTEKLLAKSIAHANKAPPSAALLS